MLNGVHVTNPGEEGGGAHSWKRWKRSVFHGVMSSSRLFTICVRRSYGTQAGATHFPAIKAPMLPSGTFNGRVALVTGGGTGLGKGIAQYLSALGARVLISSRKLDVLENTAEEITKSTGNEVVAVEMDVRDPKAIKGAVNVCEEKFGSLPQMVVNNAAGNFISPTERLSPNAFKTVVDIVLNGTANVTLELGKRLIAANQGASFLAITTNYTALGSPFVVPSAAAKAGVEALTKSLAAEWGRYGLRFNAIAPGPIETKGAFSRLDPTGEFSRRMLKAVPAGRMGEVEENANLAAYLLSDYSSWVSGAVIVLDGGNLPYMAGMFSQLTQVSKEQWDVMESLIRKT